ncbi:hypothetical protein PTSG_07296 [Salpingoeca rosetta]|uniref:WW domain-containing protein n=1 Tax=Salpingoeca rosetta (strain ATCC 50818 / BSB-021) TaxID=946362 RepID=F2UJ07_SALR5|nr:uncharacterized protein PTSG_07296 [Salpingoeca rosetta]EGD76955.1 hypothetical protein PTSG_07296 [Salpingoeca rosetta]|eukprot:XP_004990795.1 hypothetical protein PTSG_07296 [Salpingoeca rosetta]
MSSPMPVYEPGDPLPPRWEARKHTDGRWFFINHANRTTQWSPPTPEQWREAQAAERGSNPRASTSPRLEETGFTQQTSTLSDHQKHSMQRRFRQQYPSIDATVVDSVLQAVNFDEGVATTVLNDMTTTMEESETSEDDWGDASASEEDDNGDTTNANATTAATTITTSAYRSSAYQHRSTSSRRQQQQQQRRQRSVGAHTSVLDALRSRYAAQPSSSSPSSSSSSSRAHASTRAAVAWSGSAATRRHSATAETTAPATTSAWEDMLGRAGVTVESTPSTNTTDTAGTSDLGFGVGTGTGFGNDTGTGFGTGFDVGSGSGGSGGGGNGIEVPSFDAFASDMAAMADLFANEIAEEERTSMFGSATGTRARVHDYGGFDTDTDADVDVDLGLDVDLGFGGGFEAPGSGGVGVGGASTTQARERTRAQGSAAHRYRQQQHQGQRQQRVGGGVANGPNPAFRKGADASLLLSRVVQPRGPDPSLRVHRGGGSLARGRDLSLARGANPRLVAGPAAMFR